MRETRAPVRPPATALVALSVAASVVVALAADALLVRAGTSVFPSTSRYAHFRFADYATLTSIGVVAAGLAWPAVAHVTSRPRRVFGRLAVAVSAVLLLPDVGLLVDGQPADAVAVLVAMHLAVAVITYNLLVHLAPVRTAPANGHRTGAGRPDTPRPRRWEQATWLAMAGLVGVESVLGVVVLVVVPVGRPDGWVPATGSGIYVAHAGVGAGLGLAAAGLLLSRIGRDRLSLHAALAGIIGTAIGAAGGFLAVDRPARLAAMGLMLLGALLAGAAYLVPIGFATDRALPAPGTAAGPDDAGGDGELVCGKRHRGDVEPRLGAGVEAGQRAAADLAAGTCPLCPGRRLRPIGGDWICGCCETIYRLLPDDGDGRAWRATPGRYVARR
jgi:hypothetical protein